MIKHYILILLLLPSIAFASDYVDNQIIVTYKKSKPKSSPSFDGKLYKNYEVIESSDVKSKIEEIKKNPDVEYVQPNYIYKINETEYQHITNDPDLDKQWYLDTIDVFRAWVILEMGNKSVVKVAVIDTGIAQSADIETIDNYNFYDNNFDMTDKISHGTHVSGTIGAKINNNYGVAGINPYVKIIALKSFNDSGWGNSLSICRAIDYAVSNGAKIINASFGDFREYDYLMFNAISRANDAGVIFVCAAGNTNSNLDLGNVYPPSFGLSNMINVGGIKQDNTYVWYSNYGKKIDVLSPADSIYNLSNNGTMYKSGTSMACPQVTALASMILSCDSSLSVQQVKKLIFDGVKPLNLYNRCKTGGIINCYKSLSLTLKNKSKNVPIEKNTFAYPNPCKNKATIYLDKNEKLDGKLYLYSISGQKILEQNINSYPQLSASGNIGNEIEINTSNLSSGVYIYVAKFGNSIFKNKLAIEK